MVGVVVPAIEDDQIFLIPFPGYRTTENIYFTMRKMSSLREEHDSALFRINSDTPFPEQFLAPIGGFWLPLPAAMSTRYRQCYQHAGALCFWHVPGEQRK